MRFQITFIVALIVSLLLTGCGGTLDGGKNPYDGVWTMSYNTGSTSTPNTICTIPVASITIANGSGSTTQTETCTVNTIDSNGSITSTATLTTQLLTAVNVSGQGMKAVVNSITYSGQCVSQNGCSAQADVGTGGITLIR